MSEQLFEKHFNTLEFTKIKDSWGREIYLHPHVQSMYDGFCAGLSQQLIKPSENVTCGDLSNVGDLKTVRDALEGVRNFYKTHKKISSGLWDCDIKPAIAILDRMIETPAAQGCVDDQPKCTWDFYRSTLERFVYETTHLSAENADGSHDCKISKKCLLHGRIALELLGKLSAAPTPAPIENVERIEGLEESYERFISTDPLAYPLDVETAWRLIYSDRDKILGAARAYLKLQSGETEKVDVDAIKLECVDLIHKQPKNEFVPIYKIILDLVDHLANTGRLR